MTRPLVSIGIITYEQRAIAPDAVRSALAQRWHPLQVVVSDDGSKDGTADELLKIAATDDRLVVITSPVNTGITANSNRLLAACKGSYFAFMGGDDQLHPDRTARQVEVLEGDPTLAAVATGCLDFTDDPARPVGRRNPVERFGHARLTAREVIRSANRVAPTPAWMYRATCMPGHFEPLIPRCSDGLFTCQVATRGDVALIEDPLTYYRVSPTSAVGKGLGMEPLQVFAILEAEHPEYVREIRAARALEYATLGKRALAEGQRDTARALLWESVRAAPAARPLVAWALSMLPDQAAARWVRRLQDRARRSAHVG